jgi:hypothetical protein
MDTDKEFNGGNHTTFLTSTTVLRRVTGRFEVISVGLGYMGILMHGHSIYEWNLRMLARALGNIGPGFSTPFWLCFLLVY